MKCFALTFLFALCVNFSFGQSMNDSITVEKEREGYVFYQHEEMLKMKGLLTAMEPNSTAYNEMKSARRTNNIGRLIGFGSGVMLGFAVMRAFSPQGLHWVSLGIGVGLFAIYIPVHESAVKQSLSAVDTFNSGLQTSSFWNKTEIGLSVNKNQIGLTLKF